MATAKTRTAASLATLFLLLGTASTVSGTTGVTECTVIVERGANPGGPSSLTSTLAAADFDAAQAAAAGEACTFDGGLVSLSHPMSLKASDKFFATGQLQLSAIEMMVDEINTSPRCGVEVGGKRHGLTLTTYGDDSSKAKVEAIVRNGIVPAGQGGRAFWLGPYSSGLTGAMAAPANETGTVLVAGGAASTAVFRGNPTVFGTFPPTAAYLAQAVQALAAAGARTAAGLWEDAAFTRGVCAALPALAAEHGLDLLSETQVPGSPTADDLDPVARNYSAPGADPDVVVTCVYDAGCTEWIAALRRAGWSPRAQVFTVCVGMDSFVESVGTDAQYMMGISPWDPSLVINDEVVGWSAAEFAERFQATTTRTPTYHSASGAASVSVLVQAIEQADSFDDAAVAAVLAAEAFRTLYGVVSFDANGQSQAPSLFLQYDRNATVQTVYPPEARSGDLVYPMPTWARRDCALRSRCETGAGATVRGRCQDDGSCLCDREGAISTGSGEDAACVFVPPEDMSYVGGTLKVVGLVLFGLQVLLAFACAAWAVRYRDEALVKNSQPLFLSLVCFGTLVMSLSIVPLGIQGEYRYEEGQLNPDIARVDAACMAAPWLFSMGFSIVFSALFAKIVRILLVFTAAQNFVRKTVGVKDVAFIMVVVICIQAIILTCWQIIDPLLWQRHVLFEDVNGYPTKSVGICESEHAQRYLIPLVVSDAIMLLVALYLCFRTRKISSKYHEGGWITASVLSIFQLLILAIPIMIIVDNDTDASYFVKVVVVFLVSATVTMLIFFPKMYQLHIAPAPEPESGSSRFTGRFSQNGGTAVSDAEVALRRYTDLGPASRTSANRSSKLSSVNEEEEGLAPAKRSTAEAAAAEDPDGVEKGLPQSNEDCGGTAALEMSTAVASDSAKDVAAVSGNTVTSEVAASVDSAENQKNV